MSNRGHQQILFSYGPGGVENSVYSHFNIADTDDLNFNEFYPHPTNEKLYLIGINLGALFVHDRNDFTGTVDIVDITPVIETSRAGCLSQEGDYVVFSGDADTNNPVIVRTSDGTVYELAGVPTTSQHPIAARNNAGTLQIWLREGGDLKMYEPNLGTLALGSAVITYTTLGGNDPLGRAAAFWDGDGGFWQPAIGKLMRISATGDSIFLKSYPAGITSGFICRAQYDATNDRVLCILTDGTDCFLYEYSGWNLGDTGSGTWTELLNLGTGPSICFWYDEANDVYFISNQSEGHVKRYTGSPLTLIDTVPVDDTGSDVDIDYDNASPYTCFYEHPKGYVTATKTASGQWKMLEIVYTL